jgi:GAF domain-containing protein
LRESIGIGTPPWSGNLEQKAMFLGAESLAGNVVTLCRPAIIENLDEENTLFPASRVEFERSCAIFPILFAGRIAGAFLVSSAQYNHFLSQSRVTLVQAYADLIALAFEPENFFEPDDIALNVMPWHNEQRRHFVSFRQMVSNTIIQAARDNHPISNVQAEAMVWQQLEDTLIQLPLHRQAEQ